MEAKNDDLKEVENRLVATRDRRCRRRRMVGAYIGDYNHIFVFINLQGNNLNS